jgi:hypothetical protein
MSNDTTMPDGFADFAPVPRSRRRQGYADAAPGRVPSAPAQLAPEPAAALSAWRDSLPRPLPWYALPPDDVRSATTIIRLVRHTDGRERYLVQTGYTQRIACGTDPRGYETEAQARAASAARGDLIWPDVIPVGYPLPPYQSLFGSQNRIAAFDDSY